MIETFLKNLWRWKVGAKELSTDPAPPPTISEIYATQWSPEFERLMRNRLAMGFFRYGPLPSQKKGLYNNIGSIRKRLDLYEATGNDELLVDIANIAMVEFLNGGHPNKHFTAVDDGVHVEKGGCFA